MKRLRPVWPIYAVCLSVISVCLVVIGCLHAQTPATGLLQVKVLVDGSPKYVTLDPQYWMVSGNRLVFIAPVPVAPFTTTTGPAVGVTTSAVTPYVTLPLTNTHLIDRKSTRLNSSHL